MGNWVEEVEKRARKKAAKNKRNQSPAPHRNEAVGNPPRGQKNPQNPSGKPAGKPAHAHHSSLAKPASGSVLLFGRHPVFAALANTDRRHRRLLVTKAARDHLPELPHGLQPQLAEAQELAKLLPREAVHQGYVLETLPLEDANLEVMAASGRPILLLDQVTDPHNIGAILRSAAAFDAAGIVVTKHNTPEETGTLAKSASGALELVPVARVANLVQAMEQLKALGYWVAGMDGQADTTLDAAKLTAKTALVMGAEGSGMRRLTAEKCDFLVKLPISARMESLNVSNAAAIALYELNRNKSGL